MFMQNFWRVQRNKLTAKEHEALGIILAQVYGCGQRVKGTGVLFGCGQVGINKQTTDALLNGRNGNKQCWTTVGTNRSRLGLLYVFLRN